MYTHEIVILIITFFTIRFVLPVFLMLCIAQLVHKLEAHY
jgi:hypothetical protein